MTNTPIIGQVIIYMYVEGGREKRRVGQGYFRLARGGLNFFTKKFNGVSSLIARYMYILRGVHWPRWVKQLYS